jgi:hypothetical protein
MNDYKKYIILLLLINTDISWDFIQATYPQPILGSDTSSYTNIDVTMFYVTGGNYFVFWTVWDNSQNQSQIYYSHYFWDGHDYYDSYWTAQGPFPFATVRGVGDSNQNFVAVFEQRINGCSSVSVEVIYFHFDNFNADPIVTISGGMSPTTCIKNDPSIVFADNSYIVCYNGLLRRLVYTSSLTVDVNNATLIISNSTENNYCEMAYLKNGTVAVVHQATVNLVNQIQYAIVRESDLVAIKTLTVIGINYSYPAISLLRSTPTTFIITWLDTSQAVESVVAQIYDINGNPQGSLIIIKSDSQLANPRVTAISFYGFVVAYSINAKMFYQLYNYDGSINKAERQVIGEDALVGKPLILDGPDTMGNPFALVFYSKTYFLIQFFYNETYFTCTDINLIISKQNMPKIQIKFVNEMTNVYLNSLPAFGTLTTKSGTVLDMATPVLLKDVYYYNAQIPLLDSFNYTYHQTKPQCKVTFTPCYKSCYSCNTAGDTNNHQCTLCDTAEGYYPLVDNSSMCYQAKDTPTGYFLDTNVWKRCYIVCKTCNSYPTDPSIDMGCTTCVDGYYPKEENPTSCFQGNIEHYFFNGNMYRKCFSLCKSCTGYPTNYISDMLCESNSCISDYYPKIDNMSSCFYDNIPGYYFDGRIYQKCYSSCATCNSTPGTDDNHQCLTCIIDYFPKVDNLTSCFTDNQDTYYFDGAIYQKCYPSCLICANIGTAYDHKCLKCLDYYYPKIDNPTSCFTGVQEGYSFNGNNYQKCQDCLNEAGKSKAINCDPSPCLNGGVCSINLNKVKCECINNFTGSLCQYDINNLNIQELIDNYYSTKSYQSINDLLSYLSINNSTNGNFDKLYSSLGIFY